MKNWAERTIEGLVGYPVDWNATGTWVGAIGTILAVLASSLLAILVPLHVRDRDGRESVQRAINNAVMHCGLARMLWEGLHAVVQAGSFNSGSRDLFLTQIQTARSVGAQIPHSSMLGDAFQAVTSCSMSIDVFAVTLDEVAKDPSRAGPLVDFEEAVAQLDDASDVIQTLGAEKIERVWMIATPGEVQKALREAGR